MMTKTLVIASSMALAMLSSPVLAAAQSASSDTASQLRRPLNPQPLPPVSLDLRRPLNPQPLPPVA